MILKEYQQRALATFETWRAELGDQFAEESKVAKIVRDAGREVPAIAQNSPDFAWQALVSRGALPGAAAHVTRRNSRGESIPHVCFKVPTGGGKTLLGAAAIERMSPANGVVLWITPSRAIFRQTWNALALRTHSYRQTLERACGGRVKLLRKDDSISELDVRNHLCVMPVMLQAAARKNERDFLKIFRDTGNYPSFFPEVDDWPANADMLKRHPDLETNTLADGRPGMAKHSLFNVLKLVRPIIILDEAAKAYSPDRRAQLCQFNPRMILELSATPDPGRSNVLVNIPGADLHREQMIKLPLNVAALESSDWEVVLNRAKERRDALEKEAEKMRAETGRRIRPIALIRVERTGRDQRDGVRIHAEDVRERLINKLNIPPNHIRLKTADKDEIADEDLLSEMCEVRYILTKDALREGWDCPFAYVLALLDSTSALNALTQMTGRVLRQPDAEQTGVAALDESYVFCFNQKVESVMGRIKRGLEAEGMGDLSLFVRVREDQDKRETLRTESVQRRLSFRGSQMLLPTILHRDGPKKYRPLDYDADILGALDWEKITRAPLGLTLGAVDKAREIIMRVDLSQTKFAREVPAFSEDEKKPSLAFFSRMLGDVVPNPWLAADIARRALNSLRSEAGSDAGLFDRRYRIAETMKVALEARVECEAEKVFARKLQDGEIRFELVADNPGFALPERLTKAVAEDDVPLFIYAQESKKSLYELVLAREFNGLERDFAVHLDGHAAVHWWHRFVAKQDYALQGWRRARVYPDFVVCLGEGEGENRRVLVAETKGLHLSGNPDTKYKEALLRRLEKAEPHAVECGDIAVKSGRKERRMALRILFQNNWQDEFDKLAAE